MAEPYNTSPGVGNPLLPNNADNSNLTNRSGSTREAIADATSRALDTDETDDVMNASPTYPMNSGTYAGSRYYTPAVGREHLSALFSTPEAAQDAVNRLESLGVPRSDISILYRDQNNRGAIVSENVATGSKAGEGAGTGSVIGGTVGAILGALAATATSIVIPGVGLLIAGPIAGALAGAGAGGLTGGILGALVGAGIPEETARTYETGINQGGVVVVADVDASLAIQARDILRDGSY